MIQKILAAVANQKIDMLSIEITIFFGIITVIGFLLTLKRVKQIYKNQAISALRSIFAKTCTSRASEISEYQKIYVAIFDYYRTKSNEFDKTYLAIDDSYFKSSIDEQYYVPITMNKHRKYLTFPILSKKNWIKSKCDEFFVLKKNIDISVDMDGPNMHHYNSLNEGVHEFLSHFGIDSLSGFLNENGRKIWDGLTYDLDYVGENNENCSLELGFRIGRYCRFVDTYELIGKELYFHTYFEKVRLSLRRSIQKYIPSPNIIRDKIRPHDLYDFTSRPAKLGINVFVIMNTDSNGHITFVQKRSADLVEYPNFYHVAPAGTFQPLSDFDQVVLTNQYNFAFTILRELLEEVYNLEEADQSKETNPFNIFRIEKQKVGSEPITPGTLFLSDDELKKGIPLENGKYKIIPTGFWLDLVTLKPELTYVLWIKDPEIFKKTKMFFKGNWEGNVKAYHLGSQEFKNFLTYNFTSEKMLPIGAVAIAEGLHFYHKKIL